MTKLLLLLVALAWLAACQQGPRGLPSRPPAETLLFRKALSNGREVAVLRGPDIDPESLRDVAPDWYLAAAGVNDPALLKNLPPGGQVEPVKSMFFVRVELRSMSRAPLPVGSLLVVENVKAGGFDVLDLLVHDGCTVVALGENGYITLWEFGALYSQTTMLGFDWIVPVVLEPVNRKGVKVRLRCNAEDLVQVDVADEREPTRFSRSWYVQTAPEEWNFKCKRTCTYPPDQGPPPGPWPDHPEESATQPTTP